MTIAQIDSVTAPSHCDSDLLSRILSRKVSSSEWKPLGKGVMSNVQMLTVKYERDTSTDDTVQPPTQFIVKFKKTEIPLPDLFSVEGEFYKLSEFISDEHDCEPSELFGTRNDKPSNPFPFQLVKALATGQSWVMLEYISNIDTIDVHQGCPSDLFDDLVVRLAKMHSYFWIYDKNEQFMSEESQLTKCASMLQNFSSKLSTNPGTGHTLPITARQDRFLPAWPAVRERLRAYIECDDMLKRIDVIVEWTATGSHIETCARRVSDRKCTLVHGDFHIGNLLIPKAQSTVDESGESRAPWLVDWSMAGVGNPLVDLVFFLVVGANDIPIYEDDASVTSRNIERILMLYYVELNKRGTKPVPGTDLKDTTTPRVSTCILSWDDFISMFRFSLINQFIILVCYDSLCRDMADAFPVNEKDVYHDHFDRVNVRCVRMLLSDCGWSNFMLE